MARNWKVGEAVKAIQAGNKEDILDIGRRFPLFANLAAQVNEAGVKMLDCVPEYCTARKIESVLKGDVQETEDDEAAEEETPAKAEKAEKKAPKKADKKAPAKKAAEEDDEDDEDEDDEFAGKSAKELFKMCKEKGLKVKAGLDKADYIKALNEAADDEDDEDWDEEEEEETPKKKAPAKGKAKPEPKKKAAKKDDDDDEDWDV